MHWFGERSGGPSNGGPAAGSQGYCRGLEDKGVLDPFIVRASRAPFFVHARVGMTFVRQDLEQRRVRLGFIPLTDCAVLVAAQEKGFFAGHGLEVQLVREPSWANIRDKVDSGALDGAHMLAPMALAAGQDVSGAGVRPIVTAFSLGLNGNAITVSRTLHARMIEADPAAMAEQPCTARALKAVVDADQRAGRAPLTFATVFTFSAHDLQLRDWLCAAGIDPERDVRLVVIPPPQMADHLEAGLIDGYCVGEPWNSQAVERGIGCIVISGYEFWNNAPEKVLGVTRDWAEAHPRTHLTLLMALLEAAQWLDEPEHREPAATWLAEEAYVRAPLDAVRRAMTGQMIYVPGEAARAQPDFHVFHRYAANFPWRSHAIWFLAQMARWGRIERPADWLAAAREVYRPDRYRAAAEALGMPSPQGDLKTEGSHALPWTLADATAPLTLGADRFFDGRLFDPLAPEAVPDRLTASPFTDSSCNPQERS